MKISKQNNIGITLIALVVTIIVLLVLAGVSINLILGQNGIINRAKNASEQNIKAQIKEELEMAIFEMETEKLAKDESLSITDIIDELPNKFLNMLIEEDEYGAVGIYKGYEFIINENFEVAVGNANNTKILTVNFGELIWNNGKASVTINANEIGKIEYQVNSQDGNWTEEVTVSELSIGDILYARVTDSQGNKSRVKKIKIEDKIEPTAPVIDDIASTDYTYSTIKVKIITESTDSGSGFKDYTYVAEKADGSKIEIKNSTNLTETITGLEENTEYNIYVKAYDVSNNNSKSNVKTVTTLTRPVNGTTGSINTGTAGTARTPTTDWSVATDTHPRLTWSDWAEIARLISNNSNITKDTSEFKMYYNDNELTIGVGDTMKISSNIDNTEKTVKIVGFNHDILSGYSETTDEESGEKIITYSNVYNGNNKYAGITWEYNDCITFKVDNTNYTTYAMLSDWTSGLLWDACLVRGILNNGDTATYKTLENSDYIKEVKKEYGIWNDNNKLRIEETNDKLWLLSVGEFTGTYYRSNDGKVSFVEGSQYKYYKLATNKTYQIKYYGGNGVDSWTRTKLGFGEWIMTYREGEVSNRHPDSTFYIAPAFSI